MRFFYIFILLCFYTFMYAQSKKQLYKAAKSAMENKDYENATYYYHLLTLQDSLNPEYQYQLATAARLNYQNALSFYWYKKLYQENIDKYPDVIFYLGVLNKYQANYKDAIRYFEKFYKKYKDKRKYPQYQKSVQEALLHIQGCENASKDNPREYIIYHIDSTVNTKLSEYAPFMNDTALVFSSLRIFPNNEAYSQIFSAPFKNDTFQKARPLTSFINEPNTHIANFVSYKNFIFYTKCSPINATDFECKIYAAKYINYHWTEPQPISYEINHPRYNTTHPFATSWNGKNVLFFSTNRPNGFGGMDIWYAFFDEQLNFEKPINAGKNVNSEYDEITPYFDNIKQVLYYSSNTPKGFGGFDIFYTQWNNNTFQTPVNMPYPINSSHNDIYYSVSANRKFAFFSSNRIGSYFEEMPNCCNDIYYYPTYDTLGKKQDTVIPIATKKDTIIQTFNKLKLIVPLTLYFHNDEPDPKTKKIITDKNYQRTCELYLQMKEEYIKEYSAGLKGKEKDDAIKLVEQFFEDSVEYGFSQLEKFANYLEELMKNKATIKIVMKGYCSPLASTEYNINLAKRRISSLRNYFYQYKNGMFMPFIKNESDTTMGKIILVDEDIGELPYSKVSDDLKDKRNSVYSPYAAAERKIQIIAVEMK